MVRYFYAWTPLVTVVGSSMLLCAPLALIALMIVSLGAVAGLAWAIVFMPYMLGRAVARRWRSRSDASQRDAAALGAYRHAYAYAERKGAMS